VINLIQDDANMLSTQMMVYGLQGYKHIKNTKVLKIASWLQFDRNIKVLRT